MTESSKTINDISQKIRQAGMGLDATGRAPVADPEVDKEALARFGAGSATCLSAWSKVPTPMLKKLIDDLPKEIDTAVKNNDTPTANRLRNILAEILGEWALRKDKKMAALSVPQSINEKFKQVAAALGGQVVWGPTDQDTRGYYVAECSVTGEFVKPKGQDGDIYWTQNGHAKALAIVKRVFSGMDVGLRLAERMKIDVLVKIEGKMSALG
jgi:hypothetical protein